MNAFKFDPYAALAEIQNQAPTPATVATPATVGLETQPRRETVAEIAGIAGSGAEKEISDQAGNRFHLNAKWVEGDGQISAQSQEWMRLISRMQGQVTDHRGQTYLDNAMAFVRDGWAEKALALGWSDLDVFGVHPDGPWVRRDVMGAAVQCPDAKAVSEWTIYLRDGTNFYKRPTMTGAVCIWELEQ